jgi:hypothetical protein
MTILALFISLDHEYKSSALGFANEPEESHWVGNLA